MSLSATEKITLTIASTMWVFLCTLKVIGFLPQVSWAWLIVVPSVPLMIVTVFILLTRIQDVYDRYHLQRKRKVE